jgi:hypothetical protein
MNVVATTTAMLAQAGYGSADEWRYVLGGWGLISGGIISYAVAVVLKGRKLSKQLPPEKRRWLS